MEFTPMTTQAEFDAAVKSAVDAAVAETVKKYEGWLSPDAAAALAKERDDSKAAVDNLSAENKSYKLSAMKMKAANEKGIPFELAEKLSGETEDEINKDVEERLHAQSLEDQKHDIRARELEELSRKVYGEDADTSVETTEAEASAQAEAVEPAEPTETEPQESEE